MRLAFLLLLLANVAFFAWSRYGSEFYPGEAQPASQQFNAEAIRVLTPAQVAALAVARRDTPKLTACLEWGSFVGGELSRAEAALEPLALGATLSRRQVEDTAGYWVYMPPQVSRRAATQKVGELRRLGVGEYFILQEDPKFRFAISLGVFRTEEAARNRLAELRAKGVRTAQVGVREMPVQRVYFQIRDVPEPLAARLNEVKQRFSGTELKDCAPQDRAPGDGGGATTGESSSASGG